MKKTIFVSFLLVLGYLGVDKNALSALTEWEIVPPEAPRHRQESWIEFFAYAAENIFDPGFKREVGPEFHPRLSIYPTNASLDRGHFVVPRSVSEGIVKLVLPKGFKHGAVSLKTNAKAGYSVGVSYDLDNWEFSDHPGFAAESVYTVDLGGNSSAGEAVYLKFIPPKNEALSVYFDVFHYTSSLPSEPLEQDGILFFPDIDIDYDGRIIEQPGVTYEEYKLRKNQ